MTLWSVKNTTNCVSDFATNFDNTFLDAIISITTCPNLMEFIFVVLYTAAVCTKRNKAKMWVISFLIQIYFLPKLVMFFTGYHDVKI